MGTEQRARSGSARPLGKSVPYSFAAALAVLALAPRAAAAELSARGPVACPDTEELTFRVERAIGMPLSHAAALRFAVTFEAGMGTYAAQLEVDGGEPQARAAARRFSSEDCSRLGDAVGLAIALALGAAAPSEPAGVQHGHLRSRTLPPVAAPAPSLAPRDVPVALAPEQGAARPFLLLLAAELIADSGSLPAAGLGVSVASELRFQRLAVRLGGLLLLDQRRALGRPEQPAAGAELGFALGSLSLCTWAHGSAGARLNAFFCGGWELGRLEGTGIGVPEPRRGSALWTAPRLDARLSWAPWPGPVRLAMALGAAAPLQRADFFLRDIGSVHRPPVVVGRVGLGLEVSFE